MRPQHQQTVGARVVGFDQLHEVGEVPERLGHLGSVDFDETVVDPEVGELAAVRDRLGSFVLVVGKGEIQTATVDVEAFAQQAEGHHHTFGVPAGAAVSPGGGPRRLAGLGELPEREVDRRLLVFGSLHARTGPERVDRLAGQQAVVVDARRPEVHPVAGHVGPVGVHEPGDEADHLLHVVGGVGIEGGAQHAEGVHGVPPEPLVVPGDGVGAHAQFGGAGDDLVVDVGDVRDVGDLVARPDQIATQHVEDQRESTVPEMGRPVHGRTAHVHRDPARVPGGEGDDLPPGGVEQRQHRRSR